LSAFVPLSQASDFLASRKDILLKEEVEETFLYELSGVSTAKIRGLEEELRPMFSALPKNLQGGLEPSVVRYALHRYFVLKHGWYMLGLDPAGGAWNASTGMPSTIMKDRAPAYIQSLLAERQQGEGLGLHELAVFAAVLSDLVNREAAGSLQKVYSDLQLPTTGPVTEFWSEEAIKAYFVKILISADINYTSIESIRHMEAHLLDIYPDWEVTHMWLKDLRQTHKLMLHSRRNPFNGSPQETFDDSVEFVKELKHSFGSFQDLECKALKNKLVEMEYQGTGRIRLSQWYGRAIGGDWTLGESEGYLRNLGVLDETDPSRPSVVIPNYIISQTNCLVGSGFYSVCCFDECYGLMEHVEREIAAPSATPLRIAQVVSALHSDTVDAPRNLSSTLLARLDEIAQLHRGYVPLHGRLFAQWMHHAYPRECSFPHVSGTTNPMSPEDFTASEGLESIDATMEEMQRHHSRVMEESLVSEEVALPWQHVEELMAGDAESPKPRPLTRRPLQFVMALGAIASFAVPLLRSAKVAIAGSGSGMSDKQLLV